MIKLYYAPHTCSLASHIALEEAGAEYSTVRIDFGKEEQRSPNYLCDQSQGACARDGDRPRHSDRDPRHADLCRAAFSARVFGAARGPFAFAQVQAFNSYLCSTLHVAHAHLMRGHRWADDPAAIAEMKRKVPESVGACFELIEREMLKGPWVMGETYTICDPYLFTLAQWMEVDGVDPKRFPKVADHRRRVSERAAARKAIAQELG